MAKRKYAVSDFTAKARDLITFEMIEQKIEKYQTWKKDHDLGSKEKDQ